MTMNNMIDNSLTIQAEMAVIGAILIDGALLPKIIDNVNLDDFSHPEIKEVYKAILDLSNEGKEIDYISVLNKLSQDNFYIKNEIKTFLLNCVENPRLTLEILNIMLKSCIKVPF